MNIKIQNLLVDMINICLSFLFSFVLLGALIYASGTHTGLIIKIVILLPAPILFYIISQYTKHIWSFLILHIIVIVFYTFLGSSLFIKGIYAVYLAFLMVLSFRNRLKEEILTRTNTPLPYVFIFAIAYFINNYLKGPDITLILLFLTGTYLLLFLINMYLINFINTFNQYSDKTNIPLRQIRTTNHLLILIFGCLSLLTMLLFTKFPLGKILAQLWNIVRYLIIKFFSLFHGSDEEIPPIPETTEDTMNLPPFSFEGDEKPSLFWQLLQEFMMHLLTFLFVVGVIALAFFLLYKIYQHFYKTKMNYLKDKIEFLSPFDKKESIAKDAKRNKRNLFFRLGSTNKDKIRRLFYKAVLHAYSTDKISPDDTPIDLSTTIFSKDTTTTSKEEVAKKAAQMTAFYEKARYSNEECTKEDVINVKKLLP